MPIRHAFTNPKSDGGDATITRPSDWNADHVGGTPFGVSPFKAYAKDAQNTASFSKTITAVPTTRRLLVVVGSYDRDVNTPTCTNVTFTEVGGAQYVAGGTAVSVFVGVPSATSGTTLAITATGSNWIIADVYELVETLTGTVVATATGNGTDVQNPTAGGIGPITADPGTMYVGAVAQNNGTTGITAVNMSAADALKYKLTPGANDGLASVLGRVPGDNFSILSWTGGSGSSTDYAAVLVAFS